MADRDELTKVQQGSLDVATKQLDELAIVIQREDISWIDKKRLLKDHIRALIQTRRMNIETAIKVEARRIELGADIAIKRLELYHQELSFNLQREFIEVFHGLGLKVVQSQFNFMTDFGKQITDQINAINEMGDEISESFRQKILEQLEKRFTDIMKKLEHVTDELIEAFESAQKPDK